MLVADRQPGAVFAVLDRLVDSGADLAEFAGGLAEVLRALVMHHYGVTPEGLPESTLALIAAVAPRLAPEDAVRMLKLLAEAEQGIRRSAHPRLVLETLLLRWAMLDRVVDLRALLAGQAPAAWQGSGSPAPSPAPIPEKRSAAAKVVPAKAGAQAVPASATPQTTEAILAAWPEVVATAARQSRLLGQSLEQATARIDAPGRVTLSYGPDSAVFREGVERLLGTVETLLSAQLGSPVKVIIESAGGSAAPAARNGGRMTEATIRSDRLGELRRQDPALDAAADALDLELVDEG